MLQKRWPWVLFIVLVLLAASLQVLLTPEESNEISVITDLDGDVLPQSTSAALPASTAWIPPRAAAKPEMPSGTCELNKSVVYDDLTITFLDVVESSGRPGARPKSDHIFIQPVFRLENESNHDFAISSVLSFNVVVDGKQVGESYLALQNLPVRKLDGTIGPGKTLEGALAVQAPIDWQDIEIHFRPTMQSDKISFHCQNRRSK